MATFEARLVKLETRHINRSLSSLSDDELNERIIQLCGYLPSDEELPELINELPSVVPCLC